MKKVNAFVTIEYSLLLPGILAIFTMLVCMGLYLHNQCILQTNIYLMSIEGARLQADNHEQRLLLLQKKEQELYREKYVLAEGMQTTYELKGNKIMVTGSGNMANPFSVFGLGEKMWSLQAQSKTTILHPGKTLRLMKNALILLDKAASKEDEKDDS